MFHILKRVIVIVLPMIFVMSCESRDYMTRNINTVKPLSNYFVDKDNNRLTANDLLSHIKKQADIGENIQLTDIRLRKLNKEEKSPKDGLEEIYVLEAKTQDGYSSIAKTFRVRGNNRLMLENSSCKCTSSKCNNGCSAQIFGGDCMCSYCSYECKKESSITY